jgi:phytoene/squalene synthetase
LCYIPREVRTKFGLSDRTALHPPATPEDRQLLQDTIHDVASQAFAHLDAGRKEFKKSSQQSKAVHALLPAVGVDLYLKRLQKHDFDPLAAALSAENVSPLKLQLGLWYSSTFKTF